MSSPHPDCLKAANSGKIKPTLVKQEACGVCHKSKDKFKNKIMQCSFCATFGCSDCISKTFPFPQLDPEDHCQNFGTICMVCEAKLHINTVTSDILKALGKAELRAEARETRIEQVTNENAEIENQVALQKRRFEEVKAENHLKNEQMQFKINSQDSKIQKCEADNVQIQRHIDLRRMERDNKDNMIEQLKKQIEHA